MFLIMIEIYDVLLEDDCFIVFDFCIVDIFDELLVDSGFMYIMFKLYVDLFVGLLGMLFLGFMGFLFVVVIVFGVVFYLSFMCKLDFGMVCM